MKIVLVLSISAILKVFYPEIFFLAPLFLIFFLKQKKHFFTYLIFGSILNDFVSLNPLTFTLFVSSVSFLILSFLNRIVNAEKISGMLLFIAVFLLIYFGALGVLLNFANPNYLAYVFLLNVVYGAVILVVYRIIT